MLRQFISTICGAALLAFGGSASADVILNGITYHTTDPGDANNAVEIDDSALTFLAQYDAGSNGQTQQNAAVEAFLNHIGVTTAIYLGGENNPASARTGGPAGTSVSLSTLNSGLSGTWTFNAGSSGDVADYLVMHGGGGGTVDILYQITSPGVTGVWDTSEFFNRNGGQTALSFIDLYGAADNNVCLLNCGNTQGNVPEPATLVLFGAGVLGLGVVRRRRS